ncbi:MAG: KH domain-containing protein [bacterium]
MKDLVEQMARKFADYPAEVSVAGISGARTVVLELRCDKRDVGRMIGRSGRTISAMRVLLDALSSRAKKRVILEVVGKE